MPLLLILLMLMLFLSEFITPVDRRSPWPSVMASADGAAALGRSQVVEISASTTYLHGGTSLRQGIFRRNFPRIKSSSPSRRHAEQSRAADWRWRFQRLLRTDEISSG